MTSTHCVDCNRYDSKHPEICCSNSVQPKPQVVIERYEDDEFNRLMQMRQGVLVIGEMVGSR